jgi:diaminopimelate epimerase
MNHKPNFFVAKELPPQFYKYHSLNNDFIIFDWYDYSPSFRARDLQNDAEWSKFVKELCHRNRGIGADGVLLLTKDKNKTPHLFIFNQNGSYGQMCLNGLRCVAHYLFTQKQFPAVFTILMGEKEIVCHIDQTSLKPTSGVIKTIVPIATYFGPIDLFVCSEHITAHSAAIGNPHVILLQEKTPNWLEKMGHELQQHPLFPDGVNVTAAWPNKIEKSSSAFKLITYERGCGITLGCSSAAVAVMTTLIATKHISVNQLITLQHPGGTLISKINHDQTVMLQAKAHLVFTGTFV